MRSTVNVANESPHGLIDLGTKLKVIKEYEDGKSVMVIAHQSVNNHKDVWEGATYVVLLQIRRGQ